MLTEFIVILILTVINGIFAMSEAAVIASRKARLQQQADRGDPQAQAALKLVEAPNRFLSTVQIGITLIGIVAGAFGGATLSHEIGKGLAVTPLAPYGEVIGFVVVVLITTYLSLIIGELVPKRLALQDPERIAMMVAIPMQTLSRLTSPIVSFLGLSTDAVLRLLRVRESDEPPVTEDEIKAMIQQGVQAGVFEATDHEMVEGVFRLGDRRVSAVMTPRTEITWLDAEDAPAETYRRIIESDVSRFPVCEGELDHVLGVVYTRDLLARSLAGQPFDLRAAMTEPLFVPESMSASKVLESFKTTGKHLALVIGEYGDLQGLVAIQDLLEEIVGDIDEPQVVQRVDGSWLMDGMMAIDIVKDILDIEDDLPGEDEDYETLGGFVMTQLGRVPSAADVFTWGDWRFEVMDMDGKRVDKVLVAATQQTDTKRGRQEKE